MAEEDGPRRAEALFYESRKSAPWLQIVALLGGLVAIGSGIAAYLTTDDGLGPTLAAVMTGIAIIALLVPMAGIVLVGNGSVVVRLRPIIRRTIAGQDIVGLDELGRVNSMRYGGTGWRRSKDGPVLIMAPGHAVRIRTSTGKALTVVTERPDELIDALRAIQNTRG
ncbi:hypothetical protein [Actinoalloteichus hymeniacidonis]|uniref:Uncharacterized protein n=1 Tax=Actinoalloteichus hymeniacidonis TaxID=340345 RepID=A0AAC9N008_9PSEU|nr:hypothetical protein [Actinoalloteichus hymeniacidonis]AOS65998.1 hypothetical protein TL08_26145 [Actinoalloteichus hymeniacidonis]MBB5905900.1 hypothetical protein [Actinoalloteichus hymeniacidonis]